MVQLQTHLRITNTMPTISHTEADTLHATSLESAIRAHLSRYFTAHEGSLPPGGLHARILAVTERPLIEECLRATGGNQLKAAHLLGINRNTLRKKIQELGIRLPGEEDAA